MIYVVSGNYRQFMDYCYFHNLDPRTDPVRRVVFREDVVGMPMEGARLVLWGSPMEDRAELDSILEYFQIHGIEPEHRKEKRMATLLRDNTERAE